MSDFRVPFGPSETEFTEKRSRFIGHLLPVETEEQAREFIAQMKKKYYDARHNCWCYLIGGDTMRYGDDGEPQGTAGQPMLNVFQRENVTNVVCVVTRYFGGILLGAGGLTRAYSKSARDALVAAGVSEMGLWAMADIPCPYALFERVRGEVTALGGTVDSADYGADISCGEIQPLGIHMSFGAGLGGYLATRQEEKYVMNYPHHLHNIFKNSKGQFGYSRALPERTSYYVRDKGVEYLGTCVGLWTVTAAVYLALMGPEGMRELGENILYKSNYAQKKLAGLKGVTMPYAGSHSFMEFVLNFDGTGKTVAEINKALLAKHIFGGYDLSREMPQLGQSMLVCVTEKTALSDIDKLADALAEIL